MNLPLLLNRRSALGLAAAVALPGCGFALRKPPNYPFQTIYLAMAPRSELRAVVRRSLEFNSKLRVLGETEDMQTADVILEVPGELREKVVMGLNAAGQVREFTLRTRLRFRLRTPQGRELIPQTELLAEREIGFAETAALAKAEEEALLYRDMQQDLLQQMLRRLAAVRDLSGTEQLPTR